MNKAQHLAGVLLAEARFVDDVLALPEYASKEQDELYDIFSQLPIAELTGETFIVDGPHLCLVQWNGEYGIKFENPEQMQDYMEKHKAQDVASKSHHEYYREEEPPTYTLEQKRAHQVYESGNFVFLRMPQDPTFIRREGIDMQHCLSVAHKDYCRRMVANEIDLFSMVDVRDGKPKVDIEVALTKGSYSRDKIAKPTVTQVRGIRNEMPPKDEYIPALMDFFNNYGKDWVLSDHNVRNFDGRTDGDHLLARWRQIQGQAA